MQTNEDENSAPKSATPSVSPGNYSPVTVYMEDTLGAVFLGILTVMLLIGWIRAETRYRRLLNDRS